MVLLVNMGVLGLLIAYDLIGLEPAAASAGRGALEPIRWTAFVLAAVLPALASAAFLRPALVALLGTGPAAGDVAAPDLVVERAANAPVLLAVASLSSWGLAGLVVLASGGLALDHLGAALAIYLGGQPFLGGLIAAASVFFATEYLCRTHAWPALLAGHAVASNPRLLKIRVVHRLFLQMLAICFLPLGVIVLTALARVDLVAAAEPMLLRVVLVIALVAVSATVGGAWLAWLVAHSMDRPLRRLELATARMRDGDLAARVPVSGTDEIGALEEGFNLMADRLEDSYTALEARNRDLAGALDRVAFLERVKRGLDRFVPETVRRMVEEDPEALSLQKAPRDVTVLFLDIEGYTRLSEQLPREQLNDLIEQYFSRYLTHIKAGGGDINETAGDGLMIIFQEGNPDEHAQAAVRTALAVLEETAAANREAAGLHPPILVNIGIASGVCHVGSTRIQGVTGERWTYTATGPVTNLAARLGDRAEHGQALLARETAERARHRLDVKRLGPVSLKNVSEPIEVWEALRRVAERAGAGRERPDSPLS